MSSHHFVRDGQEPALYIHDAIAFHHVAPLLEWAPFVITRSSVLEEVLSWGIKADVVLREDDQTAILDTMVTQMPVHIVALGERQLIDALKDILNLQDQRSVSIIALQARDFIEGLGSMGDYRLTILDPGIRWVAVKGKFFKWLPAQSSLTLYPPGNHYTVSGGCLNRDRVEVVGDGIVEVSSTGIFWVGEVY